MVPYSPLISANDPYIFARLWDAEDSSVSCTIDWKLNNRSLFCSWAWHGGSPQHRAFKLMGSINANSPDVYAYADLGVAIHSSAIGAPLTLYDAQRTGYGFQELAHDYSWNIILCRKSRQLRAQWPHIAPEPLNLKEYWVRLFASLEHFFAFLKTTKFYDQICPSPRSSQYISC